MEKGGIIPFSTDQYGFNPGEFLRMYIASTNDKLDRLFQRPQRAAKWFSIHKFEIKTLYENAPIGRDMIGTMLKRLCTAAGLEDKYTNHCLRATGIQNLKRLGVQDRDIVNVSGNHAINLNVKLNTLSCQILPVKKATFDKRGLSLCEITIFFYFLGHKNIESIQNYDPVLPTPQKASIAVALQTRQIENVIPSSSKGKSTPGLAKKSSGFGLMPIPFPRPLMTPQKRPIQTEIVTQSPPIDRGTLKFKFRRISSPTSSQSENYAMIQEPEGKKIFYNTLSHQMLPVKEATNGGKGPSMIFSHVFVIFLEPQEIAVNEDPLESQEIAVINGVNEVTEQDKENNCPTAKSAIATAMLLLSREQKLADSRNNAMMELFKKM